MDKYLVGPDNVERQIEVAGQINTETKSTAAVVKQLTQRVPFDTGWLPPGLRSYTQSGNHAQMVIVAPPGVNRVNWGEHEGDKLCKQYLLAQPWRIIIVDTINGSLFGARMFYSPGPVNSVETPLYHQNVPNINCRGYRGNGVGWVCLYQTESWENWSLAQKVDRVIERCSGSEAYNNANMDSTDGPRFYKSNKAPEYVYDPIAWEKKTEAEGVEWTFDSSLWIPVLVKSQESQECHDPSGQPLTLAMAMNGKYNAYYADSYHPKPAIEYRKGNQDFDPSLFRESYAKADGDPNLKQAKPKKAFPAETLVQPDPVPIYSPPTAMNCYKCKESVPLGDIHTTEFGDSCDLCLSGLSCCDTCEVWCKEIIETPSGFFCHECDPDFECHVCDNVFEGAQRQLVSLDKDQLPVELCPECMAEHLICNGCGMLRNAANDMYTTKDMQMLCYQCSEICNDCGWLVSKVDEGHKAECDPAILQHA